MARLVHVTTGAVIDVRDEKVERMGSEWKPEGEKKATKKAAAKPAPKK